MQSVSDYLRLDDGVDDKKFLQTFKKIMKLITVINEDTLT